LTRPQTRSEPSKEQKKLRLAAGQAVEGIGPEEPTPDGPNRESVMVEPSRERREGRGLRFERYYTRPGVSPFDEVEWETRDAVISNEKGEKVFEQQGVEIPSAWTQTATNVVVSKYFRGQLGTPERETSVRQLIGRVADTMTAVIFAVWCVFVFLFDNVLKPLVLGRGVKVPMLVIFMGAVGGLLTSGLLGLFVGPVVLALGYTLFMAWLRKTRETALEAAEPSPAEPGGSGQTGQTSSTR